MLTRLFFFVDGKCGSIYGTDPMGNNYNMLMFVWFKQRLIHVVSFEVLKFYCFLDFFVAGSFSNVVAWMFQCWLFLVVKPFQMSFS